MFSVISTVFRMTKAPLSSAIVLLALLLGPDQAWSQLTSTWDTARVWTNFEDALQRPERVLRLDLTKQKWKEFDHRLRRFRQLRELILDRNRIDSIPPWISEFQHLERLSMRSNKLHSIPPDLLEVGTLRGLDLADNEIEGIPEDIDHLLGCIEGALADGLSAWVKNLT